MRVRSWYKELDERRGRWETGEGRGSAGGGGGGSGGGGGVGGGGSGARAGGSWGDADAHDTGAAVLVETRVGGASFQRLKLTHDKLLSSLAFKLDLRRYAPGLAASAARGVGAPRRLASGGG